MSFSTKRVKAWLAVAVAVTLTGAAALPAGAQTVFPDGDLTSYTNSADQVFGKVGTPVTFTFTQTCSANGEIPGLWYSWITGPEYVNDAVTDTTISNDTKTIQGTVTHTFTSAGEYNVSAYGSACGVWSDPNNPGQYFEADSTTFDVYDVPSFNYIEFGNVTVDSSVYWDASAGFGSTYTVSNGVLPDGLILDPNTGAITGNPTTLGSYYFEITATNPAGTTSQEYGGAINSVTVSADQTIIHSGEEVNFSTNANNDAHDAVFVNGHFWGDGSVGETPNPFSWDMFGCGADATVTLRVYNETYNGSNPPDWNTPYAATVDVTFAGDGSSNACYGDGITASADQSTIHSGESVVFTTNAPGGNLAAFFVDGQFWGGGQVGDTPNPFGWGYFGCGSDVVGTYRVYDQPFDPSGNPPDWNTPYAASVDVTFAGDGSSDACFGTDSGNPFSWDSTDIYQGQTVNLNVANVDSSQYALCFELDGAVFYCVPGGTASPGSQPVSWDALTGMLASASKDLTQSHTVSITTYLITDMDQNTGGPVDGANPLYSASITVHPAKPNPWAWDASQISDGETATLTYAGQPSSEIGCWAVDGVAYDCGPMYSTADNVLTWSDIQDMLTNYGLDTSVQHTFTAVSYDPADVDQSTYLPLTGVTALYQADITWLPAQAVNPWAFDASEISENGTVNVSYTGDPGSEVGCWAIDGVAYNCGPVGQAGTNSMTWADFEGMLEQYSLDASVQHTFSVISYSDADIDQNTGLPVDGATSLYQADITWLPAQPVVDPVPSGTYDVAPNGKGATLNWTPSQTATGYIVKVGGQVVTTLDANTTTYAVTGLFGPADNITVIAVNGNTQSVAASLTYVKKDFITLGGLTFKGDSAKLSSASKKALARYAALVAQHGFTEVEAKAYFKAAKGYSAKFVAKLQKARAAAIRSYLLSQFKKLGASVKVIAKAGGKLNRYGVVSTR